MAKVVADGELEREVAALPHCSCCAAVMLAVSSCCRFCDSCYDFCRPAGGRSFCSAARVRPVHAAVALCLVGPVGFAE